MLRTRLTSIAILLLAITPLVAADHRLEGSWKATIPGPMAGQRCTVDEVITADQKYSETVRCGNSMTWQAGTYTFNQGVLLRTLTDFQPKQHYVVDVNPTQPWLPANPPGHYEPNVPPPAGQYQVTFNSSDTMTWKDITFGGTVVLKRK
jgi:hypothetical protein